MSVVNAILRLKWVGGIGPPAGGVALVGPSGGRRWPGNGYHKLCHSNVTSLFNQAASLSESLEIRLALLGEGLDAFLCILRDEDAADRFSLDGQSHVERGAEALLDCHLRVPDGDSRSRGQLLRVLHGACAARCRIREQLVDQAQLLRFSRLDSRRIGDEVDALRQPDESRQALRAT